MNADDKRKAETAKFLDNLTEFLANNNSDERELIEDLRAEGPDPEKLLANFQTMLSQFAPTWKENAERERLLAEESLFGHRSNPHMTRDELKANIRATIESMQDLGVPMQVGAFHLKFQEAGDEDLESMLEDLTSQLALLKRQKGEPGG